MAATEKKISQDLSVTTEKKMLHENHRVFYSTADTEKWDNVSGTGDVDYAQSLSDGLNKVLPGTACYLRNINNEKDVFAFIEAHKGEHIPVLHVLRNAPRIGSAFSIAGLQQFKKNGGKLIVTAVEFHKHSFNRHTGKQLMKDLLDCIEIADEAIFLDELDKMAALKSLSSLAAGNQELLEKIKRALVICVPPTVTIEGVSNTKNRGGDIISFGMIRTGKGLAHVRKLAGLIKQSTDPIMKDKKVLVVGTVMVVEGSAPSNLSRDEELFRLMNCMYPEKRAEIIQSVNGNGADNKTLKELLKKYQLEEKEGKLKTALPIELHIDVPEKELAELFNRARYSYLPAYRGATLRNTSISCSLSQVERGLITITHQCPSHLGGITPPELCVGGTYAKSMIMMPDEEYGVGDDVALVYKQNGYAWNVYQQILAREQDSKLNEETIRIAQKLLEERLSRKTVTQQHLSLYEKVLGISLVSKPILIMMESRKEAEGQCSTELTNRIKI